MSPRVRAWLPAGVWIAMILILAGEDFSGAETRSWIGGIVALVWPGVSEGVLAGLNVVVRKGAHLAVYCVLGVLLDRALRMEQVTSLRGLRVVGIALVVSLLDEGRQSLTPDRTASLVDCGLDTIGAAAGVWLTSLVLPRSLP